MTATLADPAIRRYLADLERAARWLPCEQAKELSEQIASHLAEALPPDADHTAVREALRELGTPRELVDAASDSDRRLRTRVRRVRIRTWIIAGTAIAIVIATLTTVAALWIPPYTAADLSCACEMRFIGSGADDGFRFVEVGSYSGLSTHAHRDGQGIEFEVVNDSDYSQTILGLRDALFGRARYALTTRNNRVATDEPYGRYEPTPALVHPHHAVTVHIVWHNLSCNHYSNTQADLDSIRLQVRVGPFTRTETIDLGGHFVLIFTGDCSSK